MLKKTKKAPLVSELDVEFIAHTPPIYLTWHLGQIIIIYFCFYI